MILPVVALTMIDLRRRGKVNRLGLCGTNGEKMPGIRAHMQKAIGEPYQGNKLPFETTICVLETLPQWLFKLLLHILGFVNLGRDGSKDGHVSPRWCV